MAAKIKESENAHSPASQLVGWARQGIDSFVAAQKILLDLTAQQNALVIGMLRENLSKPLYWPGEAIATIADKGVAEHQRRREDPAGFGRRRDRVGGG